MVTVPDFSVTHTQFWCLWKEDPLGFSIHHPALIMLKNLKLLTLKCLEKNCTTLIFFLFHIKIHEISPGAIQKSNGLKVTCLMSLYFKSEEDTMKNEIPATIFLRFNVSHYQDESGMYCVFFYFVFVLMCTAYTNLANTFLISFLSKNSDLSSMLEA